MKALSKLSKYLTPRWYLLIGGGVLLVLAVLGVIGILGPTADKSLLHEVLWFDNTENIARASIALISLAGAFLLPVVVQRYLCLVIVALGFFFGVYSLFMSQIATANLESPAETIILLVMAIWGLGCAMREEIAHS